MKISSSIAIVICALLTTACDQGKEKLDILTAENSQLNIQYQDQLSETRKEVARADSLQTLVHDLEQELQQVRGQQPVYNASEEDEEAIETLVHSMHQGWTKMFETDDTNDLLKHFMPKYTTSAIRVDTDHVPSVRRKNDSNFEEFLHQLVAANNVSMSFGETKFLYTEVSGNVFVTTYRTRFRLYENDHQRHTSSVVVQLAGEKQDGEWKVGNYHWASFNY